MSVSGLLTQAGLSHLIPNFRDANLSKFKSILLSVSLMNMMLLQLMKDLLAATTGL